MYTASSRLLHVLSFSFLQSFIIFTTLLQRHFTTPLFSSFTWSNPNIMSSTVNRSIYIKTHTLPANVFDLQHDAFYNFVEFQCGSVQAKILELQLISNATTFIECNDLTEILQHNVEKLIELKYKACLVTDDGHCIVLPGIVASFKTLKKRLLKKLEEDIKKNKTNIFNSTSTPNQTLVNSVKTNDQLRNQLVTTISRWFINHRADLNLKHGSTLEETIDYHIEFKNTSSDSQSAIITCSCGSKSTLSRANNNGYFQVSF